jgi:MFS family permease
MPSKSSPEFKIGSLVVPIFLPSLLFGIGEGALLPLIPASAQSLGADIPTAGVITGLVMVGTLMADLPAVRLINRIGERYSMIAASVVAALGVLISFFANNLFVLGFGIFLLGTTVSIFSFARHSFLTEAVPFSHRARSLSVLGGVFRAGHFIGPLLGALLVTLFGVTSIYWNAAIFCSLAALILLLQKPDRMKNTPVSLRGSTWLIAKQEFGKLRTLGIASAIMGGLRTARIVGLPLWALHVGIPPATAALYIGIAGALDLALSYSSGQIMDRFGRRWAAVPTAIGLSLTFCLLTASNDGTTFLTVALLMSLANGVGSGIILVIGSDLAPRSNRTEFLASYRLLVDGGVAVTPLMIAGLTAAFGMASAMFTVAGFGFLSAFLYNRYLPRRAKPSEQTFPVSDIE